MSINPEEVFSYELPDHRIAQRPVYPYHDAKLLRIDRDSKQLSAAVFLDLPSMLQRSDLLVFNDTKVIPARFFGTLPGGGAAELLLLERVAQAEGFQSWRCIGRPLKRFRVGSVITCAHSLCGEVLERGSESAVVRFTCGAGDLAEVMNSAGVMPIPPYIRAGEGDERDRVDYQTHFALHEGSVAAPTASLHFTPELLANIRARGCAIEQLTLHVGSASFLPLWHDHSPELRAPGPERLRVNPQLVARLRAHRASGGRVIAVGTTVVRALESMARMSAKKSSAGSFADSTELFITPGFQFELVDAMVTNFHQPRSTHLLLVEAFLGRALLERSYRHALDNQFRFLSYGDGMFITSCQSL